MVYVLEKAPGEEWSHQERCALSAADITFETMEAKPERLVMMDGPSNSSVLPKILGHCLFTTRSLRGGFEDFQRRWS